MTNYINEAWSPPAREELRKKITGLSGEGLRELLLAVLNQEDPSSLIATLRGTADGLAAREGGATTTVEAERDHYRATLESVLTCTTLLGAKIAAKEALEQIVIERIAPALADREALREFIGRRLFRPERLTHTAASRESLVSGFEDAIVTMAVEVIALLVEEWRVPKGGRK